MTLESKIEAVLFWKGEPVQIKRLAALLKKSEAEIAEALKNLENGLAERGIELVQKDDEVMLGTRPEMSGIIETLTKEELVKDIGRAGLETLSIIVYRGPTTRRDIDYIRGVNSSFIVRNLMIRGLIERVPNPSDERSFLYKPTFQLLQYLGVGKLDELPELAEVREELARYEQTADENDLDSNDTDGESTEKGAEGDGEPNKTETSKQTIPDNSETTDPQ